ncbi:hypothetical protein NQ314_000804 [Rhamnusium bicolor]|uniref:Uncharacterized protein n=1 Tax=Rhamnusium bicolor TaxID=1586634 RepID=A0AAV8ZX27_9CUCU|nr:hypothetical protein NQ314_000804 [Rhamnusium bicolor]
MLYLFVSVTPDPIKTGKLVPNFNFCSSFMSAGSPVDVPVKIIPSERKNSAARAVSTRETSFVIACELKQNDIC